MKTFEKPNFTVKTGVGESADYAEFEIKPLERGFGNTLGNSLRRVLLSSIESVSVCAIRIEGVHHEFSAIPGVVEDATTILLNLKNLVLGFDSSVNTNEKTHRKELKLDVKGPKIVTAADLQGYSDVIIKKKDTYICEVADGGHLIASLLVQSGRGFLTSEQNRASYTYATDYIPTDCVYSPVLHVSYEIEGARLGKRTDFETLLLKIRTNGAYSPQEVLKNASQVLVKHFEIFVDGAAAAKEIFEINTVITSGTHPNTTSIEQLELSVRSSNCLRRANIQTIGDLIEKSEEEMMRVKNLGKKSLKEVKEYLAKLGLSFKTYE
jgi:DNA-directed RNA polymerase subunit alpha